LAYRRAGIPGQGPTVVAIHGLGSSTASFARNLGRWGEQADVIAVDLPGFGYSAPGRGRLSLSQMGDLIRDALLALGVERAIWVGHSMGAQLSMLRALKKEGDVRALMLLAPAGFERFSRLSGGALKATVTRRWVLGQQRPKSIRKHLALGFFEVPREAELLVRERLRLSPDELEAYAKAFLGGVHGMLDEPVHARLGELSLPVEVVFGAQDRLIPSPLFHPHLDTPKLARSGTRKIPGARLTMVDRAGHLLHFERPVAMQEPFLRTLKRAEPEGAPAEREIGRG
jgi:pimeloyl-ACP methyl ester carboxylesterase